MPRKSALEFLQKETTVAAILQVNISNNLTNLDKFTSSITGLHPRSSPLQVPPRGVVQQHPELTEAADQHVEDLVQGEGDQDAKEGQQLHPENEGEEGAEADDAEAVPVEGDRGQRGEALPGGEEEGEEHHRRGGGHLRRLEQEPLDHQEAAQLEAKTTKTLSQTREEGAVEEC